MKIKFIYNNIFDFLKVNKLFLSSFKEIYPIKHKILKDNFYIFNNDYIDDFSIIFDSNSFLVELPNISDENIEYNRVYIRTFIENIIQELQIIDKNMKIDFFLDSKENDFINQVKRQILKV